ncbi:MAG: hypothetical protein R2827_06465 [Bdellovibrionales bacterium]
MAVKKLDVKNYEDLLHKNWANRVELIAVDSSTKNQPFEMHQIGLSTTGDIVKDLAQAKESNLMHIIQPEKFDFIHELNSSALMTADPELFFKYPASSILSPIHVGPEAEERFVFVDYEFNKSSEKHAALILLEVELEKFTSNQSLITTMRSLADEMFTNAIYNAPFVENVSIQGEDRGKVIDLPEDKKSRILLARDEQRLIIACVDPFGSLKIPRLINKVYGCFKDGAASQIQMDSKKGAGIGTFMLFDASPSTYVAVSPNQTTIFACVLPLNMSARKIQELPKSFHFIFKGGE